MTLAVSKHVHLALGGAGRCFQSSLKELVLVGGVVGNDVDNDSKTKTFGLGQKNIELFVRAKKRIDGSIVGYVVAGIFLGGFEKW